VAYGLGQIDPINARGLKVIGGFFFRDIDNANKAVVANAPRIGLANMGAWARAPVTSLQSVAVPEFTTVGFV